MNLKILSKCFLGAGLGILGIMFFITSSDSFESKMVAMSADKYDTANLWLMILLGTSVLLLIVGGILTGIANKRNS